MSTVIRAGWYWLRQNQLDVRTWEDFATAPRFQGKRIAVVGNAGYLAELNQGQRIDGHDLVLRMNNYVTAGFEPQVGSHTDIWLTTFHDDVRLDRAELRDVPAILTSVPFNFTKTKDDGLNHRHGSAISQGLHALGRRKAFAVSLPFFRRYFEAIGRYPTTGALAIALVVDLLLPRGARAFITGFSFFEGPSHYFSDQEVNVRNHDLDRERDLLHNILAPHLRSGRIQVDPEMADHLTAPRHILPFRRGTRLASVAALAPRAHRHPA